MDITESVNEELQVSGYVMLSRAKYLDKLWILQPFSQKLFTQGPPAGPHILMHKLKVFTKVEEPEQQKIKAIVERRKKDAQTPNEKDPMKMLYCCTQCLLSDQTPYMKPAH